MENVVLIIHLLLALSLIGVVLLQRSEGGGLGMGGGGAMTGRAAATALGKVTWGLAIAFICTSIALTVIAARDAGGGSVIDTAGLPVTDPAAPAAPAPATPDLGTDLLPPPAVPATDPATDPAPLVPPAE
jgi:preprotein translocase subunit SecG